MRLRAAQPAEAPFSDEWTAHVSNSSCSAHGAHDKLPWRDFLGEGSNEDYTNAQVQTHTHIAYVMRCI